MERINHLIEVASQSHHMPWVLAFLVGLFVIKKDEGAHAREAEAFGDNIPTSLLDLQRPKRNRILSLLGTRRR
jgi:hypothetical protein